MTALRVQPSLAGLALLHDTQRGGFVVVYARGPRSYEVVRIRVAEDDPTLAAAQYYGGLAEYRFKRVDRMAAHFEAFLKLAPNAPERPEVESIMRTVRGRQN